MAWLDLVLPLLARLSHGWHLTYTRGFACPEVVDHALSNQPTGSGRLGLWAERWFLRQPHWRALRAVQSEIEARLEALCQRRRSYGLETFVLDFGYGCGRYAWKLIERGEILSLLCLRRQPNEISLGRAKLPSASRRHVEFQIGDRLDPASFLMAREPDVAIFLGPAASFSTSADLECFFSLTFRCLCPGGVFFFGAVEVPGPSRKLRHGERACDQATYILRHTGFQQIRSLETGSSAQLLESWKGLTTAHRPGDSSAGAS
ncbi:MAG: class I SAM-dependent methyltransferase family protein [Candidatus Binatia bacterium]|nr:class I SAM-dependent methyltransferase family protein [Candidatus Binatia bacterium]